MFIRRHGRAIAGAVAVAVVSTTAIGIGSFQASNAEGLRSETHASSQFLGGALSDVPLGVTADNAGTSSDVSNQQALVSAPANPLLQVGVANQVAVAATDGLSRALTGAVDNGSGVAPADLQLSLDSVLGGTPLAGVLSNLTLNLGALSTAAAVDANQTSPIASDCADMARPEHCRDYRIAGGALKFKAPLVGDLVNQLVAALGQVTTAVNGLAGPNGQLAQALKGVTAITNVIPVAQLDLNATVSLANLEDAVRDALKDPLNDGVLRVDLTTGEITADFDKLVTAATGKSLNDQAPNTQVLSKAVIDELTARLVTLLSGLPARVVEIVETLVDAAVVNVNANLCILGTGTAPDCKVLGAPVGTGLALSIEGSVAQLLSDKGAASLSLTLAGATVPVPLGDVTGALLPALKTLTQSVATTLPPAVNGLVSTVTDGLRPALDALPQLLSLIVNVQEQATVGGVPGFAQSALKLSVAGALDVELARSAVSARFLTVDDPDPVDPDPTDPVDDPEPVDQPDPIDPDPTTPDPLDRPDPRNAPGPAPTPSVPTSVTAGV